MEIEDYYRTCQLFSLSGCLDKTNQWSSKTLIKTSYFQLVYWFAWVKTESEQDLESSFMMLQNSEFTNGLSANPCPLHYKAESETSKLGWAWIWKFLLNLHPNLVSHEKKYISAWFEMVHIASTNGKEESTIVNVSLDILTQISLDPWCSLDMQNTAPPPPQLPCFFHPQYGRHSSWIITSLRGKLN